MIRGSTPTHNFKLSLDTAILSKIKIIYAQDDKKLFEKNLSDCTLDGNTVSVKLTQEDTFMFDWKKRVQIQIRALTLGGEVVQSSIKFSTVGKCLDDEVL